MKLLPKVAFLFASMLIAGCSRVDEAPVLLIYHEGREYRILDRGSALENGEPTFYVRYYSGNIHDDAVLRAEREDLLAIMARHINTNHHSRARITAVASKESTFVLFKPIEVTANYSVADVMKYRADGKVRARQ